MPEVNGHFPHRRDRREARTFNVSDTPRLPTIAIHGGYEPDPITKAVAVPIHQTVGFAFDSAEHGAALFDLDVQGHIYTRIDNPTNAVLERRVAALEGGVAAL